MFQGNVLGHDIIWGAQKYLGRTAPECSPWLLTCSGWDYQKVILCLLWANERHRWVQK